MPTHDIMIDTGHVGPNILDQDKDVTSAFTFPPGSQLDNSVAFSDGGLGSRYQGQAANGIQVIWYSTNAGAYPNPNDGCLSISYSFTLAPGIPGSVSVKAHAHSSGGPFAAGNWMNAVIRVFYT